MPDATVRWNTQPGDIALYRGDDYATRRRIEIKPRPSPLIEVSMANADEFLQDGDFGLSVGEGHFPARVIQKITKSPYVHTISVHQVAGIWMLCESTPPRVRVRPLVELVSEESGLYDFYRLAPGLCDLDKAWAWACKAEGTPYSYLDLWLVWRRRYLGAKARGKCGWVDFPTVMDLVGQEATNEFVASCDCHLRELVLYPERVSDPKPNSDIPDGCRRDCSSLWRAACRVNWIGPPEKLIAAEQEFDADCVPGDFSVPGLFTYVATLI